MTKALLLGAGASADAGLPTTRAMTRRAIVELQNSPAIGREVLRALHCVCGAIIGFDSARGADPYDDVDIERLVSAVELLANRDQQEIAPFVSWDAMLDDLGGHAPPAFFDQNLGRALLGKGSARDVVIGLVKSIVGRSDSKRTLDALHRHLTRALVSILSICNAADLDYLRPIVDLARRQGTLTVATLNYDIAIETVCDGADVGCCVAVDEWFAGGEPLHWRPDGLNLMKLHGSIDWMWGPSATPQTSSSEESWPLFAQPGIVVGQPPEAANPYAEPVLVFGQRGKLRAAGPFLELLLDFGRQVGNATELVCVGYSFRDDHVNEYIRRWMGRDESRKLTIIDYPARPQFLAGGQVDFRRALQIAAHPFARPGVAALEPA